MIVHNTDIGTEPIVCLGTLMIASEIAKRIQRHPDYQRDFIHMYGFQSIPAGRAGQCRQYGQLKQEPMMR